MKTLITEKLLDSVELISQNDSFFALQALNEQYPNDFLKGLYRQEVIHYNNKFYVFGGGNIEGTAYPFDLVNILFLEKYIYAVNIRN